MIEFPWWFPREYLALAGAMLWAVTMFSIYKFVELMERREARREATAAPESRPKSSE